MLEANSPQGRRIREEFKASLPSIIAGKDHFLPTPLSNMVLDLPTVPITTILQLVCNETSFNASHLRSKSKRRRLSCARFLYYMLADRYGRELTAEVAKEINRDVSSASHGLKRAEEIYRRDLYNFRHHYHRIEAQLDAL